LKTLFHTAVWRELQNIHGRAAIARTVLKTTLEGKKCGVMIIKPGWVIIGNNVTWSDESSIMFPTSFWVNVWSMPKTCLSL